MRNAKKRRRLPKKRDNKGEKNEVAANDDRDVDANDDDDDGDDGEDERIVGIYFYFERERVSECVRVCCVMVLCFVMFCITILLLLLESLLLLLFS